ncbi:MAG TPA: efflux transporter outer membrane subunit [Bryobacteraceae bacterium]|nr:efflux transporter outer membrane subunit [Bryobacteraceae bacterium]
MTRLWKYSLFSILVCSGCTIGPKYQRPAAPAAPAFKELNGNDQWKMATPSDQLLKGKWWEMFNDPELNRLEELVDINNQNVKQAEAQFRQARALVAFNHANYYPTIGSNPSITQSDSGGNGGRGAGGTSQSFSLPATVSWEPDLWGRVRLSVENAAANAQVSAADLENIRLSAQALLATDYFIMVGNDMQQAILADTIQAYQRNLQLTINRFNGGVASRSDITLAQTQLAGAQAQSTDLRITRAQLEHAIAVLTGQPPSALEVPIAMIAAPPPPIPLALPSTLLERRPDIAANERLMAAANANIGIAQTAYYPTLTLSATPGLLSNSLASLFTWGSRVWSAGPSISQTLFDFGRRNAQVQGTQAAYDATVAAYRQTVLSAFQEVEDDLASLRYLAEEAGQQAEAVVAAEQALVLENARYIGGTDSYLNVITTQTIELTDKQAAVTILQRRMLAAVDLVKALGGGWDASTLPSTDQLRSAELANPDNTQKIAQPTNR